MFHLYHSAQIIYVEHYFGDSFAISWQGMKFSSAIFLSVFFYWLYYTNDAKFFVFTLNCNINLIVIIKRRQ